MAYRAAKANWVMSQDQLNWHNWGWPSYFTDLNYFELTLTCMLKDRSFTTPRRQIQKPMTTNFIDSNFSLITSFIEMKRQMDHH